MSPQRKPNRFDQLNEFCDVGASESGLSMSAAMLWMFLWRHADEQGGVKQVSAGRIASCMPIKRRTITAAIKELHAAGLLKVVQEGREDGTPAVYRIRPRNFEGTAPKPRRKRSKGKPTAPKDDAGPVAINAIAV